MKVLITGSRDWNRVDLAEIFVDSFDERTIFVHGDCRGADRIVAALATKKGHVVRAYPADWDAYGRSAGPIRNQEMLDREHLSHEPIDAVFAFHNALYESSKGTLDMCERADRLGLNVHVISSDSVSSFKRREKLISSRSL